MPIPMPPPPPPYVAPDLHPIVSTPTAALTFIRSRSTGRVMDRALNAGLWIAAEGAPLELRYHRRADGSIWGEQATYEAGDRQGGIARASAAAHTQVLSKRVVGGMAVSANFVRFTVLDRAGTRQLRQWSAPLCGTSTIVRLDRVDSPEEPTYPGAWMGCSDGFGGDGAYVLGRMIGLDRGWAMQAPTTVPRSVGALAAGRYQLRIEIDPLQGLADANRANDATTVPLRVSSIRTRGSIDPFGPIEKQPTIGLRSSARSAHKHARPEPQWYLTRLKVIESALEARAVVREVGPAPRAGEPAPAAPAGVDLPDLRSAPSYGVHMSSIRRNGRRRELLRFGALTWNAGPGRLEVEAFRETGTTLGAYQVFFADGKRSTRQARGTLIWHAAPGHDHFHFGAFARYQLTRMDGTVVRDGGKHSWCIVDTDQVDTTRPGVVGGRYGFDESGNCGSDSGSLWARLSMSVGAGDYYGPDIAGQSFDVTGLPNGSYRIRTEANPTGVIAEADHANNVANRVVTLSGRPGARVLKVRPVATINEGEGDFDLLG